MQTVIEIFGYNIAKCRQLYQSLILSKFLYGLQIVWLSKVMRQRVDALYCQGLRKILGIPHPYISRVSNATVLERAKSVSVSTLLLRQQMIFYGRIARNTQHPGNYLLTTQIQRRRRGRPLLEWSEEVQKHIVKLGIGAACSHDAVNWRKAVNSYSYH